MLAFVTWFDYDVDEAPNRDLFEINVQLVSSVRFNEGGRSYEAEKKTSSINLLQLT